MGVRPVNRITQERNELHPWERVMDPSWCLGVEQVGGTRLSALCRFSVQREMRQIPIYPLEVEGIKEVNLFLERHSHIVMSIEIVME
jgi:hypothetical protein